MTPSQSSNVSTARKVSRSSVADSSASKSQQPPPPWASGVTVIEAQPRLMARVVAPAISDFYRDLHASHGVDLRFGAQPAPAADLTIVGIGVVPNDELMGDAGCKVDGFLRTADENIYAIGDCAEHEVRLESVQNAVDQAKYVATHNRRNRSRTVQCCALVLDASIRCDAADGRLVRGFDALETTGDVAARKFSLRYFKGGKLIAVDSINSPGDHIKARKELAT